MSNWRTLHYQRNLRIGMWVETGTIYFTIENLTPNDVMGKNVEVDLKIRELEKILEQAKIYEKQIAGINKERR